MGHTLGYTRIWLGDILSRLQQALHMVFQSIWKPRRYSKGPNSYNAHSLRLLCETIAKSVAKRVISGVKINSKSKKLLMLQNPTALELSTEFH